MRCCESDFHQIPYAAAAPAPAGVGDGGDGSGDSGDDDEFIDDDELVEVTPNNIRLRKKLLKESDRKRAGRAKAAS